jgi:hypothetical protein
MASAVSSAEKLVVRKRRKVGGLRDQASYKIVAGRVGM